MGLESMKDRDEYKSLDKHEKKAFEEYGKSKKAFFDKDKNMSEEERQKRLDAELDAKLKQMDEEKKQNEKQSKEKQQENSESEIASIESGLNAIEDPEIEDMDFEFDKNIGRDSIDAIAKHSEEYENFNKKISEEYEKLTNSYNQLNQVVARFKKEKENDTYFTGDDSYEQWVDEINSKIDKLKAIFTEAQIKITDAVNKSEHAGKKLDEAPDNLKIKEAENLGKTEGQFQQQHQQHVEKLNTYGEHGQKLDQTSQALGQNRDFLNNYSNQLGQTTDLLTNQKQQLDNQLLNRNTKIRHFQSTLKAVCVGITPFSDQELKQLIANPESFIQHQPSRERKNAALNLYNKYGQNIAEYLQILDNYGAGVQQSQQLSQAKQEVTNRKAQVDQSTIQVINQKTNVDNEKKANDIRINETKGEMVESEAQHIKSQEYYSENIDNIDQLDSQISDIILDNSIQNHRNLDSLASFVKSFDGLKVSEKSWNEKLWDSTIGGLGKLISNGCSYVKDKLYSITDMLNEYGEKCPNIGMKRLFKAICAPMEFQQGVIGGVLDLVGGIGTLVSNPLNTLGVLGSLVGRDPETGKRSFETAGESRKNLGKAIICYDEFGEGHDARAAGEAAVNILSFFIPGGQGSGAIGSAIKTARLAHKLGKVPRAKAALIGGYDLVTRVGGKLKNGWKGLKKTFKDPKQAVMKGLGFAEDVKDYIQGKATAPYKKVKNIYTDLKNGGIKLAVENHVATTYGGKWINGCWRYINGEPLFGKAYPSLKNVGKSLFKMKERYKVLNGKDGKVGKMYEKVKQYVDKDGNLIPGKDIPRNERGRIIDYQSGSRELKLLKNSLDKYKGFYDDIIMDGSKLGKFIRKNPKIGETLEKMLYNPSKAEKYLAKFKTKNPKIDLSELDGTILFRDGGNIYYIENGGNLVIGHDIRGYSTPNKTTHIVDEGSYLKRKDIIEHYAGGSDNQDTEDIFDHYFDDNRDVAERA